MGNGLFGSDGVICRHAHWHSRIPADGQPYLAIRADVPVHQGEIFATDAAVLQLAYQMGLRPVVPGYDQEPRGILVQTMHDPGARYHGELGKPIKQAIKQGAGPISGARMRHQARQLVDHNPVGAGLYDPEGYILWRKCLGFRRQLLVHDKLVPRVDLLPDAAWLAIDLHMA